MLRNLMLFGCTGLAAVMLSCAPQAAPDTRDADVKAVKDVEAAAKEKGKSWTRRPTALM